MMHMSAAGGLTCVRLTANLERAAHARPSCLLCAHAILSGCWQSRRARQQQFLTSGTAAEAVGLTCAGAQTAQLARAALLSPCSQHRLSRMPACWLVDVGRLTSVCSCTICPSPSLPERPVPAGLVSEHPTAVSGSIKSHDSQENGHTPSVLSWIRGLGVGRL